MKCLDIICICYCLSDDVISVAYMLCPCGKISSILEYVSVNLDKLPNMGRLPTVIIIIICCCSANYYYNYNYYYYKLKEEHTIFYALRPLLSLMLKDICKKCYINSCKIPAKCSILTHIYKCHTAGKAFKFDPRINSCINICLLLK